MTESKIKRFYQAWWYLNEHKIFRWKLNGSKEYKNRFDQAICIDVVKINPKTRRIDDDHKKNTEVQIWLECGPLDKKSSKEQNHPIFMRDYNLDCGGTTFEDAIIALARLVKKYYN